MKLALLEDGKILLERMVEAYRDDKYQKNLDTAEREGKAMMAELGIARIDGLGIAFPRPGQPAGQGRGLGQRQVRRRRGLRPQVLGGAHVRLPLHPGQRRKRPRSWARSPTAARRTRATS